MLRIHYHLCPEALGEYNHLKDIIILYEGFKKYQDIRDSILKHEREHVYIFKEHGSWIKRLFLT